MALLKYFSKEERIKRLFRKVLKLSHNSVLLAENDNTLNVASTGKAAYQLNLILIFLKDCNLFDDFLGAMNRIKESEVINGESKG